MEENEKLNKFLHFFKHFDILPEEQELEDKEELVRFKILFNRIQNRNISGLPRLFKR